MVPPDGGCRMINRGGLFTVTVTTLDAVLPAASCAVALSVCGPLAAVPVFHDTPYGAVVSFSAQNGAVQVELHAADADIVGRGDSERRRCRTGAPPSAGAVKLTRGSVVSSSRTGVAMSVWISAADRLRL